MFFQKNKSNFKNINFFTFQFNDLSLKKYCYFLFYYIFSTVLYSQNILTYPVKNKSFQWYMNTEIEPYIFQNKESSFFIGENNLEIYYEKYTKNTNNKAIVISHGFTEYIEKYHELIFYFLKNNYNVYIMEHRGHGRSGRLGIDNMQVEVEDYNYYVSDFKKFIDEVVLKENKTLYLYAHSMGGAIGALFLQRYPDYFEKAVLSSPMMTMKFGKLPNFFAKLFIKTKNKFTLGRSYAPSTGSSIDKYDFEKSSSSSLNRYDYYYLLLKEDSTIQLGGPSIHWVNEMLDLTKEINEKENIKKVKIPILLFQSENDKLVKKRGQNKFAKYSNNTDLILVNNAKHELYRENDEILFPYLDTVLDFFK